MKQGRCRRSWRCQQRGKDDMTTPSDDSLSDQDIQDMIDILMRDQNLEA